MVRCQITMPLLSGKSDASWFDRIKFMTYNELARYVNTKHWLAIKRFILEFTTSIGRTINVYRLLR